MPVPCLCGDPYCGSCGNPEHAALEDAEQELCETMHQNSAGLHHYRILIKLIPELIKIVDEEIKQEVNERFTGHEQYVDYLKGRIADLEGRVEDVPLS